MSAQSDKSTASKQPIDIVSDIAKDIALVSQINSTLNWDQETYMPENAIEGKAEQIAFMSALGHKKMTSDELGSALSDLGVSEDKPFGTKQLDWSQQRLVRAVYRAWTRATKLPERFVREMAMATSTGQSTWVKARQAGDFKMFSPKLEQILDLKREEASLVGYKTEAYDALLDEYEPSMSAADIDTVFTALRADLVPLVKAIAQAKQPDISIIDQDFDLKDQEDFSRFVVERLGYDWKRGRLDHSAHPFSITLGRDDARITTRFDLRGFANGLFSSIHETGHALYELGFDADLHPFLASGTSLGIHESQSRTWENMVGRSLEFWGHFFPELQKRFPKQLAGRTAEQFYRAINKVEPSFIRVDADEVTYGLHIMLRFNLELGILRGKLKVNDLPEAWKAESQALLGITPADDKLGVLQDIHWSIGAIGYFPTYALGNLYGAMFFNKAKQDMPALFGDIAKGQFSGLRNWLKDNIHKHGSAKTPKELLHDVTGESLDHKPYIAYLTRKYKDLYAL